MILHRVIRRLASWALWSFFREIRVIGEENVPQEGPIIVVCTHHNMMIDPAVLSSTFPHKRPLHYWAKSSLFKNPIANRILADTGNIPVDRKNKDNQVLFRGTFDALAAGEVVALFPEGTIEQLVLRHFSPTMTFPAAETGYTEPRIMQVKDGASWSALEYMKWAETHQSHRKPLVVIPAGIVYTNKSKYRSSVIVEFGNPILMKSYQEEFFSAEQGHSRAIAKRLTAEIERELVKLTINSPNWETLYAARMARDLLWRDENAISLEDFVGVSQTLVDLFSTPTLTPSFGSLKNALLVYYSLLRATGLTNSTLSDLPLPETLDPSQIKPFPSRISTLFLLLRDSLASLVRLPFFLIPLIVHLPAYAMSRLGARLVQDEEETQAQNKIIFGLLFLLAIYPAMFFFLWALFWLTPIGAVIALAMSYAFIVYHVTLVDDNYEHAKRLVAAWRVLLGVWAPKRWDLSLQALAPYTTPYIPPVSAWIDPPKVSTATFETPTPAVLTDAPSVRRKKRPATRRLIRHVLRARSDAARLLAAFFLELERSRKEVRASTHLAQTCGGRLLEERDAKDDASVNPEPRGWRDAREVVQYLRDKGAKIGELGRKVEGDWAAASSDIDGEGVDDGEVENHIVWAPSEQTS